MPFYMFYPPADIWTLMWPRIKCPLEIWKGHLEYQSDIYELEVRTLVYIASFNFGLQVKLVYGLAWGESDMPL